jgi:putative peptidoglycan lipid II flippase
MIRPILTVSAGTLASRLTGFARDAMVAALLGAGPIADAFLVAFQLVNVVRRLLTEGALNAALVPAWLRLHAAESAVAAAAFAGRVLGTISLALVVASVGLGLLMPLVIAALAPGFVGQPSLQLAVDNARLMLPYLAFAGPVAVMMGLLNAQRRVTLAAFSPLLFNAALIGVMAVLMVWQLDAARAAQLIAGTVGIAGALQLAVLLLQRGNRIATPLRAAFDAPMRAFFGKAIPGMIANSGPQLISVAAAVVASSSPSAVSWLYFATRLIELPLGMVGAAMGAVLVPELSRAAHGNDTGQLERSEARGLELAIGLALPAMIGLIVLREPIVRLLFQRGAFDAADTLATAQALALLALALPAHVLVKALSPRFFAHDDTHTPLLATLCGIGVALVAALALAPLGVGGIAAGIALAAWSSAAVLVWRSGAGGVLRDPQKQRRLAAIAAAALGMGGLLWLKARYVLPLVADAHGLAEAAILGVLIAGGVIVYGGLLALFGVVSLSQARDAIRRPPDLRG